MKEWFEQRVILPHIQCLEGQLQVWAITQANAHDLVKVMSRRLRGWNGIHIQDSDVGRSIAGANQVQCSGRAHSTTTSDNDDLGTRTEGGHLVAIDPNWEC